MSDSQSAPRSARSTSRASWFLLAIVAVVVAVVGAREWRRAAVRESLASARAAFANEDYVAARSAALDVLASDADSPEALLIAGGAAAGLGDVPEAIACIDRLPRGRDRRINDARALAANLTLLKQYRASDAERRFREVLADDPRHLASVSGLASLLGLAGRRHEAIPLYLELIRQGQITTDQLSLLGAESGASRNAALHNQCLESVPDDPIPLLGLTWESAHKNNYAETERLARRALKSAPDLIEAHALLGRALAAQHRFEKVPEWQANLPPEADENPEVWRIRGDYAREALGERRAAARCYWESLRRDPNVRATLQGLLLVLKPEADPDLSAPFARRMEDLQKLLELQAVMYDAKTPDVELMHAVVDQLERLGRLWEAMAWTQFAVTQESPPTWAVETVPRLAHMLERNPPLTLPEQNPALQVDLSDWPLPDWGHSAAGGADRPGPPDSDCRVRFVDVATDAGLHFQYRGAVEPGVSGVHVHEFNAGGTAILDYDRDGWPDIQLTQGSARPAAAADERLDRLYRNDVGRRARDVTSAARLHEESYSQGVAAGDFDDDGFADLYVANIGANRLFHNNGDGTFSLVQLDGGTEWTTSCLVADLSGDGLPDLYDVNYLGDADVFERVCRHNDGVAFMCPPYQFTAAQDRFLLNQGDGRFADLTREAGFVAPGGRGLGLVAGDFDGRGRLSLFVANDTDANFYFHAPEDGLEFRETGLVCGLAYGDQGRSQSGMGVAAGDFDEDGRLDLLVTNFAREYNALYLQALPGLFSDEIRRSGMAQASLAVLGFGTQALDGDLDGRLDLVVSNGHIQNERAYTGDEYQMPPQFFHGLGGGRFAEAPADGLGPYFAGRYLGRSMARLDWNRDRREDVAISHLDVATSLLLNATANAGHSVALRLVGTTSSRDAIGAIATLQVQGRTIVRHLTAGDGFQASNQRLLVFGLGEETRVDGLTISWPSGLQQQFADLPVDSELLLVEKQPRPLVTGQPQN